MNTRIVPPLAALLVALTPCPSHATESTGQDGPPVLVWGVTATEDVPRESVDMLSFTLVDEFDAVTGMATTDDQLVDAGIATVADSDEWSEDPLLFLAAVARQTRSAEAVTGELNDVGGALVLTLQRIDSGTGLVVRQVTGQTRDDVQILVDSIPEMIARLYDIEYQTAGTVAESGSRNGYSYVVATFGNPFEWIKPLARIGRLPLWGHGETRHNQPRQEISGIRTGAGESVHARPRSMLRPERRMPPPRHVMPDRPDPRRERPVVRPERNMPPPRHVMPDRPDPRRERPVVRPERNMPPPRHVMPDRPDPRRERPVVRPERNMPPPRHVMPDRPGPRQYPSGSVQSVNGKKRPSQAAPGKRSKPSRPTRGRGGFGRR